MSDRLEILAAAKVNLFLHVVSKMENGLHGLQSLVCFADIGDTITIEKAPHFEFVVQGDFASGLGANENNLVVRAARMMASRFSRDMDYKITLTKSLPVAAGIGGGSADAAAVIRGLAQLWDIQNYPADLGFDLGADIPACLKDCASLMEGTGEKITPVPHFPALHCVLINPLQSCSTADVFRSFSQNFLNPIQIPDRFENYGSLIEFLLRQRNDLSAAAEKIVPEITVCLGVLKHSGSDLVRMSGSGASCFGLYETQEQARMACEQIQSLHPEWWVRAAVLNG